MELVKPVVIGSSEQHEMATAVQNATFKRDQNKDICRKLPRSRTWICEDTPFLPEMKGGLHKFIFFVSTER